MAGRTIGNLHLRNPLHLLTRKRRAASLVTALPRSPYDSTALTSLRPAERRTRRPANASTSNTTGARGVRVRSGTRAGRYHPVRISLISSQPLSGTCLRYLPDPPRFDRHDCQPRAAWHKTRLPRLNGSRGLCIRTHPPAGRHFARTAADTAPSAPATPACHTSCRHAVDGHGIHHRPTGNHAPVPPRDSQSSGCDRSGSDTNRTVPSRNANCAPPACALEKPLSRARG